MARVRPLSEMAVSCPERRICSTSGWPTARAQSREPLPKACRLAAKLDESLAIGDEHGREGAGGKQARAETVDVDADGVHEAIAGAGEGEANREFLRGGSPTVGIQPSRKGAIESSFFVQDDGRGTGIHHQLSRAAIDRGDHYRTPVCGSERDADAAAGRRTIQSDTVVAVVDQIVVADEPAFPQDAIDARLKYVADDGFHGTIGDRAGADFVENSHGDPADAGNGCLVDGIGGLEV